MEDREILLRFVQAHYNETELAGLAQRVGLNPASNGTGPATPEALLLAVEREGMAASLLARVEQDFPNILPPITWAGATIQRPPYVPSKEPEPVVFPRPALTLQDNTPKPVRLTSPDVPPALLNAQSAPAPDSLESGAVRPFRFVHGYTLPPHWARRDRETAEIINELHSNRHAVLALIAIGGTGKSALTRKVLDELPAFDIVLDGALWFSFYVEPDFDRFLVEACHYVLPGFDASAHPSPYEKSVLLREGLAKGRYLLVMDGIEVLLNAERDRKTFGTFQDRALREFLEGLGEGTRSQILVSSRFPLADLEGKSYYRALPLGDLSPDAADELLVSLGVGGEAANRAPIYARFGTHALTLQVLGDYLTRFFDGSPEATESIPAFPSDATQGIRLQAILDCYWQRMDTEERFFLTRMSAFRGGVDERSLIVLNRHGDHSSTEFRAMVKRLLASPLVSIERRDGHARLTSHPLIKTFFYDRMGDAERDQTHRALKDFAQGLPLPDRPKTLEDYEPLLQACHHCLQVGLYTEAYQMYRRNNMDNALRWWGHYTQAISLLEPLREASQGTLPAWRSERWQKSWVENETALLALMRGDLDLAIERFEHSAQMDAQVGDGPGQSASLQNLAGALIQRGDYGGALKALEQSRALENTLGRFEKEDMLFGLQGVCLSEQGALQEGYDLLQRAAEISVQRNNLRALCYWTWRAADICFRARQHNAAKQRYDEALKMAQREQFRDYMGHVLRGLSDTARAGRDFAAAHAHGTEALRIARTLGNPYLENEALLSLARLAHAEGSLAESKSLAQQAAGRAESSGYQAQAAEAAKLL